MSTETAMIVGVQFIEQRPTHDSNIEYWLAKCDGRLSEVFLLPKQQSDRLKSLPNLIGFTQCQFVEVDEQLAVIMPGVIQIPTTQMLGKIGMTGCVGIAWHISDLLSLLHQSGRSHNLLHPESIGLNDVGELEIRPALGRYIPSDPDPKASAIATDCWQMRKVVQHLGLSEKADPLFALLQRGLTEEFSRLRLQPATAIRQSIAAVLARHAEWEEQFVANMGSEWALNQRNLQENTIIPHRLKSNRPTLSMDAVKDMSDSIDLWGNMFTSSSVDEVSSSQALLLEALNGKTVSKMEGLTSKIQLPSHTDPIEQESSALEINLIGPTSIQVPVQSTRTGLVSIQEVGMDEVSEVEEQGFYHGFSAIVEETADNLEVLHRRRRSHSRKNNIVNEDILVSLLDESVTSNSSAVVDVSSAEETEQSQMFELEVEATELISTDTIEEIQALPSPVDVDTVFVEKTEVVVNDPDNVSLNIDVSEDDEPPEVASDVRVTVVEERKESDLMDDSLSIDHPDTVDTNEAASVDIDETIEQSIDVEVTPVESRLEESSLQTEEAVVEPIENIPPYTPEDSSIVVEPIEDSSQQKQDEDYLDIQPIQIESIKNDSLGSVTLDETGLDTAEKDLSDTDTSVEDELSQKEMVESEGATVEMTEAVVKEFTSNSDSLKNTDVNDTVKLNISEELLSEESEADSEEAETTRPVSIFDMPLMSIVEEDDFSVEADSDAVESEESEDEAGVSIQFLIDAPEPKVSHEQLEQVFDTRPPVESSDMIPNKEGGFVATLAPESAVMSAGILDVEEPLADIDFPSIEEVHAQDKTFAGDVNSLFDSSEPVVTSSSQPIQAQLGLDATAEPKWTGATSFENLTNSEDALGDEKYAHAQVELGDVDAVLGESIRDFSEMERRGSPWGLLLLVSLVVICVVVYLLNTGDEVSVSLANDMSTPQQTSTQIAPSLSQVEIQTDPPRGTILIDSQSLGVAPVQWELTEGDVFLMCVDWGSNPVCRRVPKSDFQSGQYTFTQRLTP